MMSDDDFEELFERIASGLRRNEMKPLARKLGLSNVELRDIELTYSGNLWRQKLEILRRWKSTYRDYATRERVKRALEEVKMLTYGTDENRVTETKRGTRTRKVAQKSVQNIKNRPESSGHSGETNIRSVHLRGNAVRMSPRWSRPELSAHPSKDETAVSGHKAASPDTMTHRPASADEVDDKGPHGTCNYRGGRIIISINLHGATKTGRRMAKETRGKPSRMVSMGTEDLTYGNRTNCFPLVHNELEKSCQVEDGDNSAKISRGQLSALKSLLPMNERLTNVNLDSQASNIVVGRAASSQRVQQTVDAFEANFEGLFVDDVMVKCIILNCRISTREVLEALWQKYENGTLGEMLQRKIGLVRWKQPDDCDHDVDNDGYDGLFSDGDDDDDDDDDNDEQRPAVTVCIEKHDYISCRYELALGEKRHSGRFDETHGLARNRREPARRDLSPLPVGRKEERGPKFMTQSTHFTRRDNGTCAAPDRYVKPIFRPNERILGWEAYNQFQDNSFRSDPSGPVLKGYAFVPMTCTMAHTNNKV